MANNSELVIKISGDIKDYKAKLAEVNAQTQDLKDTLGDVTKYATVAFAAFTAEIGLAVHAFGEAEKAANELTQALKNQGIFSDKLVQNYKEYAEAVQEKTGIDDDAVTKAQAIAQSYLGQIPITQELTNAIADLGATMGGDLNGAAEKIARTIGTSTNAFARQGLVLQDGLSSAERYGKVLEFVNLRAGNQAEIANRGVGAIRGVATAFGNLQEKIGQNFAPVIEAASKALITFFNYLSNSPKLVTFISAIVAGGAAFAGITVALGLAAQAFLSITAVLTAFGVAASAATVAVTILAGATGIGLLVVALGILGTYLLDTSNGLDRFKGKLPEARDEIKKLGEEIAALESKKSTGFGLDSFESELLKKKQARKKALEEQTAVEAKAEDEKVNLQKQAADRAAAVKRDQEARELTARRTHLEQLKLENSGASEAYLAEKQKENEIINQLATEQDAQVRAQLEQKLETQRTYSNAQQLEDQQRQQDFAALQLETDNQLNDQRLANTTILMQRETDAIQAQLMTRYEVAQKVAADELKANVARRNQFLEDEKKFGTAYATINQAMHSAVFQGTKTAFGELAQLQQSSNSTLKTIGKVAAVANIVIRTAESAMNIYAGFSTIPIIGPTLGVAGAAAAVAFGAEQVSKVNSAADGALVTGGIPGKDSVPFMLMPGETVVPTKNFEEVIGSTAASRAAQKFTGDSGGGDNSMMVALLTDISAKLDQSKGDTYVVQGDVLAEQEYIMRFGKALSDAIEFGGLKIKGINV